MNETETRALIDEQLRKVGWEVDTDNFRYSKGTRPVNGRNIAFAEWKTVSEVGYGGFVDYALFIGTKLVGLIETKASYKNVSSVIDYQCKDYARNISAADKKYLIGTWDKFQVPFFATDGRKYVAQLETMSGIWFQDLRKADNAPKALRGRISPNGILELLEKNIPAGNENLKKMSFDFLCDRDGLSLRDYQLKTVQAVENAVIVGKKNILLAMATGINKTHFEIYDAVGVYESLEQFSEMKPVVANSAEIFESLLEKLKVADDVTQIQKQINQLLGKLQRAKNKLSGENLEQFQSLIGEVKNLSPHDAKIIAPPSRFVQIVATEIFNRRQTFCNFGPRR